MGFLCYQCDGTGKNYRDPNCVLAVLTTLVIVSSIEFTSYALLRIHPSKRAGRDVLRRLHSRPGRQARAAQPKGIEIYEIEETLESNLFGRVNGQVKSFGARAPDQEPQQS